jgi:hypothetical protein
MLPKVYSLPLTTHSNEKFAATNPPLKMRSATKNLRFFKNTRVFLFLLCLLTGGCFSFSGSFDIDESCKAAVSELSAVREREISMRISRNLMQRENLRFEIDGLIKNFDASSFTVANDPRFTYAAEAIIFCHALPLTNKKSHFLNACALASIRCEQYTKWAELDYFRSLQPPSAETIRKTRDIMLELALAAGFSFDKVALFEFESLPSAADIAAFAKKMKAFDPIAADDAEILVFAQQIFDIPRRAATVPDKDALAKIYRESAKLTADEFALIKRLLDTYFADAAKALAAAEVNSAEYHKNLLNARMALAGKEFILSLEKNISVIQKNTL